MYFFIFYLDEACIFFMLNNYVNIICESALDLTFLQYDVLDPFFLVGVIMWLQFKAPFGSWRSLKRNERREQNTF